MDLDYRIGLDIGTNSVGWSVIQLGINEQNKRYEKQGIIDLGIRMFDKAEIPKTGASLAEPRRLARSSRRRLRRKSQRKRGIRDLLVRNQIIEEAELKSLYPLKQGSVDIWDIRVEALDRKLSRVEWTRLLIHLAQRRGFKSNRKSERKDKEVGQLLSVIEENQTRLSSYRTVGEMWMKDEKFASLDKRRNSPNEYIYNVSRADLEKEIRIIFENQRQFGSALAPAQLEEDYLAVWNFQLPFASGTDILEKVGYCSLEPSERRAPKATYTFQYFIVLDKLNNIRLGSDYRPLSEEERTILLEKMFDRTDFVNKKTIPKPIKYKDLRKWLTLDEMTKFKGLNYDPETPLSKVEDKDFVNLQAYYELKKVAFLHTLTSGELYEDIDFDTFGYALTVYKNDKDIRAYLSKPTNIAKRVYSEELIEELLGYSYSKFGHLSFKAMKNLFPVMASGRTFKDSADDLQYDTTGLTKTERHILLPVIPDELTNPIVKRALSQTRKVVNAIIKKYGSPVSVHIELARELSKNHEERKKVIKEQEANLQKNKGAIAVLLENNILHPTGYDIVRYKLWKEQNERCAYSLRHIPASVFFAELRRERNSAPVLDVDHILPYSQSFMDSYMNKVLVYSDENRKKGNRIPFDYLNEEGMDRWNQFEEYVLMNKQFPKNKKEYLVKKEYHSRESDIVKERHLNDTRYATKFFKNFVERTLIFKETKIPMKKIVQTVNGRITAHLRSRWGLEKVRKDSYLHHALDAVVVACTDQYMVTRVTEYYQQKERPTQNKLYFPMPWEGFREDLLTKLSVEPIPKVIKEAIEYKLPLPDYTMVSRMPKRSVSGAAHKETIMARGGVDEKSGKTLIVKRVALKDIKFDKNGDFDMVGKESDLATYEAIKNRYLANDKNVNAAFTEPLYKPSYSGNGNQIKRVKVYSDKKSFVREVNGGVAQNGDLVRIDIFKKEEKYHMIPIYVLDTSLPELPNKLVTSGKGYDKWRELDNTYCFQFSLYPYDLVRVVKGEHDEFLYLSTIDISGDILEFRHINRPSKSKDHRFSLKTIDCIEKYEVGILGNVTLVKNEKRRSFQISKNETIKL
ncbi:CRISPR-associated endonuclease Csn1 [Bacillus ectoiniformans]|uniref:type II CRISPR RNA-guided endonuclease Cas9 n=1 Tax=Bacillus ectoiniformans TaxID=1494429 RepID=UPI001958262B|nr:type II CRISPR RNA-guided endonuclease Cas9 [Bacillus ectoiniformans]MBM7649469.1 CRISPR-associated endonuclease Csn1 [Bacillus ectoiniformans]